MTRKVTIVLPADQGDASHVVIAHHKGYLFTNYNDAVAFADLLIAQLAYPVDAVSTYPLAPVTITRALAAATEGSC
jgi:hypothetical protein